MTGVPVLLYHGIGDRPDLWTVAWERFRADVDAVLATGRRALTVAEWADVLRSGGPVDDLVVVSFDDGEASQLPAAQHLADAGVPCTVYVTCEHLGREGMLDVAGLRDLAQVPGVEIGSHAVRHLHLDVLRREQQVVEARDSRARLEDLLGRPVLGIAYPHGSHDRHVVAACTAAGYTSGAAVKNALSHERDDPMSIARVTQTRRTTTEQLAATLRGEGRLGETSPRLRTRGFRYVRRARAALSSHA